MDKDNHEVLNKIAIAHGYAQMVRHLSEDDRVTQQVVSDLIKALEDAVRLINR